MARAQATLPNAIQSWKHLEQVVTTLLAKLDPGATVRWQVPVPRRTFGHRNIDTVIDGRVDGIPAMVIVNSKKMRRRVDVNQVHELQGTMADVGADRGIIVSTRGFSRYALDVAAGNRIETCILRPAEEADWVADGRMRGARITGNLMTIVIDEVVLDLEGGETRPIASYGVCLTRGPAPELLWIDQVVQTLIAQPGTKFVEGKLHKFEVKEPIFFEVGQEDRQVAAIHFRAHRDIAFTVSQEILAPQDWVFVKVAADGRTTGRTFFEFAEIDAAAQMERAVRAAVSLVKCPVHGKSPADVHVKWEGLKRTQIQFRECCGEQRRAVEEKIDSALREIKPPPVRTPGGMVNWHREPVS